jgi:hypothetical protein
VTKGQHAPRNKAFGLRARAWWVMRETPRFTLPSLLAIVADGDEADAASNLGKYLRALSRAGILAETGRDKPACLTDNGHKRYRLAVNRGPKAPVWRASRSEVYDPNTGAVYSLTPALSQGEREKDADAGHE